MPLYHDAVETPAIYANIKVFVEACLVEMPGERVAMSEIYEAYQSWCASVSAAEIHSLAAVGRMLTHYGVRKINSGGIKRIGIALRDEPLSPGVVVLAREVQRKSPEQLMADRAAAALKAEPRLTAKRIREAQEREEIDHKHQGVADWARQALHQADAAPFVKFLYSNYVDWCDATGQPKHSSKDMAWSLEKAGFPIEGTGLNAVIRGWDTDDE